MKKLLLIVFCILPTYVLAVNTYDPETKILHLDNVSVGADNYEAKLSHKGNLVFSVLGEVTKKKSSQSVIGSWKSEAMEIEYKTGEKSSATFLFIFDSNEQATLSLIYDIDNDNVSESAKLSGLTAFGFAFSMSYSVENEASKIKLKYQLVNNKCDHIGNSTLESGFCITTQPFSVVGDVLSFESIIPFFGDSVLFFGGDRLNFPQGSVKEIKLYRQE